MGGLEFHPSSQRGRWARRLPHLPATFEVELESKTGVLLWRSGHTALLSIGKSVPIEVG